MSLTDYFSYMSGGGQVAAYNDAQITEKKLSLETSGPLSAGGGLLTLPTCLAIRTCLHTTYVRNSTETYTVSHKKEPS